jgi:alpha-1,3-fucosyltransferase
MYSFSLLDPLFFDTDRDLIADTLDKENHTSTFNYHVSSSDHYPYLNIHMATQNLSMLGNSSKLILTANNFFDDNTWGLISSNKTSRDISKQYEHLTGS